MNAKTTTDDDAECMTMTAARLEALADALERMGATDVSVRAGGAIPSLSATVAERGEGLPADVMQAVVGHGAAVRQYKCGRLLVDASEVGR